jgi:hypothetical protein
VGSVAFGALDPRSITQQRWKEVRYRLYNTPDESYIAYQGMVLNRYNVITSGELNFDVTPEVVLITSLTTTLVSIRSAHMNADRVFNVIVDGAVLSSTAWTFDAETQIITLVSPLPSAEYPVTVTFAPGKAVTNTYLCSQPFSGSVTKLNEGTPPYPMSQTAETTREVIYGAMLNDPTDTLGDIDFILNDPFQSVHFTDPEGSQYEQLEFCEVDDGGQTGLLSIFCDGPSPENGLIEIALSGRAYWDQFSANVPGGPGGPWRGSGMAITGTAAQFNQTSILHASGGSFVDGVLGPGTAVLYPNYAGATPNAPVAAHRMGVNQEIKIRLEFTSPFTEDFDLDNTISDNVPPTYADFRAYNPDGGPGVFGHGACMAMLVDYGPTGVSRLGPWGGLPSLEPESLLAGGGFPPSGIALTLCGGALIPGPTITTFQIEAAN